VSLPMNAIGPADAPTGMPVEVFYQRSIQ
jgi:hypothetical protein